MGQSRGNHAAVIDESTKAFAQYEYDSDYFENAPIEFLYNDINFGLTKTVDRNLSVTAMVTNLTQFRQGYPFVYPNAIHRVKAILTADYHLPL